MRILKARLAACSSADSPSVSSRPKYLLKYWMIIWLSAISSPLNMMKGIWLFFVENLYVSTSYHTKNQV